MTQTTTETTAAAPTPAVPDKGLFARAVGIVVAPRQTFEVVAAYPKWLAMFALTIVVTAVLTGGFFFTSVGQQAFLDMMERRPGSTAQSMEIMQKVAPYMGYITIGQLLIITPIVMVIIAGLLMAVFTMLGGNASFKQVLAVLAHTGVISVLGQLVVIPLNYVTGSMTSSTNLGVLVPMLDDRSFLAVLLGSVDLFRVWLVVVLSIGLAVIYKRRTAPIATSLFVLYALIAIGYAALTAARS